MSTHNICFHEEIRIIYTVIFLLFGAIVLADLIVHCLLRPVCLKI